MMAVLVLGAGSQLSAGSYLAGSFEGCTSFDSPPNGWSYDPNSPNFSDSNLLAFAGNSFSTSTDGSNGTPVATVNYVAHTGSCFVSYTSYDGSTSNNPNQYNDPSGALGFVGIYTTATGLNPGDSYSVDFWVKNDIYGQGNDALFLTWNGLASFPSNYSTANPGMSGAYDPTTNSDYVAGSYLTDSSGFGGNAGNGYNNPSDPTGNGYTEITLSLGVATASSEIIGFYGEENNDVGYLDLDDVCINDTSTGETCLNGNDIEPPTGSIPEPTTLLLLGSGLIVVARRLRAS